MRLIIIQCCASKRGVKELFSQPRSILADLPTEASVLLEKCRKEVVQRMPTRFKSKRLTALSMYDGALYSAEVKENITANYGVSFQLLIMSGGYGILRPDETINEYNVNISETRNIWEECLPSVMQAYLSRNAVDEIDGIFSRSADYYLIARKSKLLCGTHSFRIHWLVYHRQAAQTEVPALQGKLLLQLIRGKLPREVDGVPVSSEL